MAPNFKSKMFKRKSVSTLEDFEAIDNNLTTYEEIFDDLKQMPCWKITNIIVCLAFNCNIDLNEWNTLKEFYSTASFNYDKSKFNGATVRLASTGGTVQLFRNGKAVLLGLNSFSNCTAAIVELTEILSQCGYTPTLTNVEIKNICVSHNFNFNVNLENLVKNECLPFYLEYELSPNVKLYVNKTCITLTKNGVLYCTGNVNLDFYAKIYLYFSKMLLKHKK